MTDSLAALDADGTGIPVGLVPASRRLIGSRPNSNLSDDWFELAFDGKDLAVVIDLSVRRRGWCYDAFWDGYGVAGSMAVVATSFSEFVERLLADGGADSPYWTQPTWKSLGDAYDD